MQGLKVFPPPAAILANIMFLARKAADQAVRPCFSHPALATLVHSPNAMQIGDQWFYTMLLVPET